MAVENITGADAVLSSVMKNSTNYTRDVTSDKVEDSKVRAGVEDIGIMDRARKHAREAAKGTIIDTSA